MSALWISFWSIVVSILALDLFIFNKHAHKIGLRESVIWSIFCITAALAFNVAIYFVLGGKAASTYLTAFLVEKSLSVDNLFVFLLIFRFFQVDEKYQHRVLFWGVLGAIVMRFLIILSGTALIEKFHWVLYFFGALLVYMGVKLAFTDEDEKEDPSKNIAVKLVKKVFPISSTYHKDHFFIRQNGLLLATPLLLVLVTIEFSDLVFAVDSIPAVFGISQDFFIVLTSNIFAILGLRALFFVLLGIVDKFRYLQPALSFILSFIGVKMLIAPWYVIDDKISLSVVVGALILAGVASAINPKQEQEE